MKALIFIVPFVILLNAKGMSFYKVEKGDSFYSIAKKMKVNYLELAKLNKNRNLRAGQEIKLPNVRLYKVIKGDNVYRISKKLKIPVKVIIKLNGDLTSLYVGQLLKMPRNKPRIKEKSRPKKWIRTVKTKPQKSAKINNEANSFLTLTNKKTQESNRVLASFRFIWPATGNLIQKYGIEDEIMHYGLKLKLKQKKILSMEKGIVSYFGKMRGLGNTLTISHGHNAISLYGGLKNISKKIGDEVKRGEHIGNGKEILFFSLYEKGSPVDPAIVIKN